LEEGLGIPWKRAGHTMPLIFRDAAFSLEPQFLAEFASAASDRAMMTSVLNEVATIEVDRNHDLRVRYEHWKENAHEAEENLMPGVFVLEHVVEHLALEGVIVGMEALATVAAEGAALLTEEIATSFLLGALEGLAIGTAGLLTAVLHWVLPILLIPQTIYMIWKIRKHFKEITHHTKAFIMRLVFKSDCMEETTRMLRDDDEGELKSDVRDVCGPETEKMLHTQIHRTNAAMEGIFTTLEEVGRCLWPHNKRAYAKIGCAERVYRPLREIHGHAGVVFLALSFAVAYAHFTDDLLEEPWYGDLLEQEFGIELPHTNKTDLRSLEGKSVEVRSIACMQLLATHRAFERTFLRLRSGIQVWLQTYGRSYRSASIRHSWWPCRKVFNSIEHGDRGFCKHVDWAIGHHEDERSLAPQEEDPCHAEWRGDHTSLWPEVEEAAEKEAEKRQKKEQKRQRKEAKRAAKRFALKRAAHVSADEAFQQTSERLADEMSKFGLAP